MQLNSGHPVQGYFEENLYLKKLLEDFSSLHISADPQLAYNLFNQIAQVDVRYTRKENQLFPYLEKRGWFGPSQGMWTFHDENRKLIKQFRAFLEEKKYENAQRMLPFLVEELSRMIMVEENRLLPYALELLTEEDWAAMKLGEVEIGWMHKKNEAPQTKESMSKPRQDGEVPLSEGALSFEQLNLMLQVIPFDLTFVDEYDRVRFYNRGEERVFPRSAGVIGREVRFCHPPKSVDKVLEILEEFKSGRQDTAEFWINFKGRVVHIRYFAVRDSQKRYKGVIEVSQDVTEIKKLEGEQRLVHWGLQKLN